MLRILYVEDDPNLAFVTKDSLNRKGYNLVHCADGETALMAFRQSNFDICLLDVMLPKLDGFSLAKLIREKNEDVPILFLTAKGMEPDRIEGFKLGGDDYIVKPFSIEELALRIEVFKNRKRKVAVQSEQNLIELGSLSLNLKEFELELEGKKQDLTPKEAQLLALFMNRVNQTLTRQEILNQVWGDDDYFNGRSLDVFISRLRKYISSQSEISIKTIHGVGFKLVQES